jgi:hypothetical protein
LRPLYVDGNNNTYSYDGGKNQYSGGQWSGGRLHYMAWNILNSSPRTPVWDAILLILAAVIVVCSSDASTESIQDTNGNDLSAHGTRATIAIQSGRNLDGYFANTPISMAVNATSIPGEILLSRGVVQSPATNPGTAGPEIGRSRVDRLLRSLHLDVSDPLISLASLESAVRVTNAGDFNHKLRGNKVDGSLSYIAKSALRDVRVTGSITVNESVGIQAQAPGTALEQYIVTFDRAKPLNVQVTHKISVRQDYTAIQIQFTSQKAGSLKIATRPGLGMVDLIPSSGILQGGTVNIVSVVNGTQRTQSISLGNSGCGMRLKINAKCVGEKVGVSTLSDGAEVLQSVINYAS